MQAKGLGADEAGIPTLEVQEVLEQEFLVVEEYAPSEDTLRTGRASAEADSPVVETTEETTK